MIIEYYKKNIYGSDKMYIKTPEYAEIFRHITAQQTLTENVKENFEKLGFKFDEVLPPK
jgi:hypothetical protein